MRIVFLGTASKSPSSVAGSRLHDSVKKPTKTRSSIPTSNVEIDSGGGLRRRLSTALSACEPSVQ